MHSDAMRYAMGIDIGVTNVKAALVSEGGEILLQDQTPTHAEKPDWPSRVRSYIQQLERQRGKEAQWLGIAAPGLAAPDGSCIGWMQGRLGEVEGLKWSEFLGRKSVPVLNDAQAALLGEVWKGSAAGARNAILLTLGTGVGGAMMVDGRILKGQIGRAGHFGHACLDVDGANDIVNTPGSLENAIGNCTVSERSGGRFRSTHELVAAAQRGDSAAAAVWDRSVRELGCAIVSFINIADPQVVIIGGGMSTAGAALFEPLNKILDRHEWRPHGRRARLVAATLGEFAGAIGAARNAIESSRGAA